MRKTWIASIAAACVVAIGVCRGTAFRPAHVSRLSRVRALVRGCHAPDARLAGTDTLEQRYHRAEPAALKQRTDPRPAYINWIVRHGINLMPRTRKTEVSDAALADLGAYLTKHER